MGLVFHGCERVGEGRGLVMCVTAAKGAGPGDGADVKGLQ